MSELLLGTADGTMGYAEELGTEVYEKMREFFADHRVITLNKEIDNDILDTCVPLILKWNMEDKDIPAEDRKPITILVNSPGGNMFSAFTMIDVIQNSLTPIRTVAIGFVASAAYYIYICGRERISFNNTVFLQHDGAIQVSDSRSKVKDFIDFNSIIEDRIKSLILKQSKMDSEFYDSIFEKEYYFYPDKGVELGVVDKIIGVDVGIESIL